MKKFGRIFKLWGQSFLALFTAPLVWIPLLIMLALHLGLLYILFLFPRLPFRLVLGPIVKRFYGELYLHYPFNFYVLPLLAKYTRQGLVLFFDFYFVAVLALLANDFWNKQALRLKSAFREAISRFFPLLAYSLIMVILLFVIQKVPPYIFKTIYYSPLIANKTPEFFTQANQVLFYVLKFLGLLIQTFFIFTVPYLVIGGDSLLQAVDKSFRQALHNYFSTLFLLLLPALVLLGLEYLVKTPQPLVEKYFPEIVFLILLLIEKLQVFFQYLVIFPATALIQSDNVKKAGEKLAHA